MKALNIVAAVLGGMALGAAAGLLFVKKLQTFCVKKAFA